MPLIFPGIGKKKVCPECGSDKFIIDHERAQVYCARCGTVIEESLPDLSPEWRVFPDQVESRRRVGSPIKMARHDLGLGTKVGKVTDRVKMAPFVRRTTERIGLWQERISTALERNIKAAAAELRRVASFLGLPEIVEEEAAMIYREAAKRELVRGRSMESVVAGALYAACRKHNIPKTLSEIAEAFPLDKREVGKTYRFICRKLGIRILPTPPSIYLERFASKLRLPERVITRAKKILEEAEKKEITSGKGPLGVAAAALYIAALLEGVKKTQREVADVAGVTEVTIRNRYKEIVEKLGLEKKIRELEAA